MSLLFTLFYIAAAGNESTPGTFERLCSMRATALTRIVCTGGSQLISLGLAKRLGEGVILENPVREITQSASRVHVKADRISAPAV